MPIYQYSCNSCGKRFEELRKIEDRYQAKCECGSSATLQIAKANPILFKPQFFEHLDINPMWVESKRQLKEECKKRGVWAKCLD